MATPTYNSEECPNCGTAALYSELAGAEGAPVFGKDAEVKAGQRVTRCDACGVIVRAGAPPAKKAAGEKASSSKRKGSSSRRPQASKRARKRSSSSRK